MYCDDVSSMNGSEMPRSLINKHLRQTPLKTNRGGFDAQSADFNLER